MKIKKRSRATHYAVAFIFLVAMGVSLGLPHTVHADSVHTYTSSVAVYIQNIFSVLESGLRAVGNSVKNSFAAIGSFSAGSKTKTDTLYGGVTTDIVSPPTSSDIVGQIRPGGAGKPTPVFIPPTPPTTVPPTPPSIEDEKPPTTPPTMPPVPPAPTTTPPGKASGTLSASPNPCVLSASSSSCTVALAWSVQDTKYAQLWRTDGIPHRVSCLQEGSGTTTQTLTASSPTKTFVLHPAGGCADLRVNDSVTLAQVTVTSSSTPQVSTCLPNEKALTFDTQTVACVTTGTPNILEARQYGYASELPPRVVMEENNERYYLLSTSFSNVCHSGGNYLTQSVSFSDCSTVLTDDLTASISSEGAPVYQVNPDDSAPWKRSYAGIFGTYLSGNKIVGIVHGENQNINRGSRTYLNTVKEDIDPSCVAGYDAEGIWQNCWTQFASFANLVWWTPEEFRAGGQAHDIGPVLWNHRSYENEGEGPYHPTLFKNESNFYLYSVTNPSWGWPCLTAARASIKMGGLPGAFFSRATDGSYSQRTLPSGFSLTSIRDFYGVTVPESACLFDATYSGTWFSVTRVAGTPYYLSLEERYLHTPDVAQVVLRVSDDPGNWKDSSEIILEEKPGAWGTLNLTYPMFSDARATQLDHVDPVSFFVVGNNPNGAYVLRALPLSARFFSK